MADPWEHPVLVAEQENRLSFTEDGQMQISDEPIETAPDSTPASDAAPADSQEQTPPAQMRRKVEFDPDSPSFYEDVRRYANENPHFRNVIKSFEGRQRKDETLAEIAELRAQVENYRLAEAHAVVASVPDEEREARYLNDPEFRSAFDMAATTQPVDPSAAVEDAEVAADVNAMFDQVSLFIPEQRLNQWATAIAEGGCQKDGKPCPHLNGAPHGVYDHDASGKPLTRYKSMEYLRANLTAEALKFREAQTKARPETAAPPATQPATAPAQAARVEAAIAAAPAAGPRDASPSTVATAIAQNRLARATPDMSPGSSSAPAKAPIHVDEFRKMSPLEVLERWPNPGDYERDVDAGLVLIPGVNA